MTNAEQIQERLATLLSENLTWSQLEDNAIVATNQSSYHAKVYIEHIVNDESEVPEVPEVRIRRIGPQMHKSFALPKRWIRVWLDFDDKRIQLDRDQLNDTQMSERMYQILVSNPNIYSIQIDTFTLVGSMSELFNEMQTICGPISTPELQSVYDILRWKPYSFQFNLKGVQISGTIG